MFESGHSTVLANDGGDMRCRVAAQCGELVALVEIVFANVSTDCEGAVRQVRKGLAALSARIAFDTKVLAALRAFVGLSVVTGPEVARRLRMALPIKNLRMEDDRPGALGASDGVTAHRGTGSLFCAQSGCRMAFSGGWGPMHGDEAFAHRVVRGALKGTLEMVDQRCAPRALSDAVPGQFGGACGTVRFGGTGRPDESDAITPTVNAHAANGGALAIHVLSAGASEIARSISQIGWSVGQVICLTRGLGPHFKLSLQAPMQGAVAVADGEPLARSLSLARDLEQETRS